MSYHSDHARKAENRHKRSPYPRAAHHGKHAVVQGFPSTVSVRVRTNAP